MTTQIYIHRVPEPTGLVPATVSLSQIYSICHQSPSVWCWSCDNSNMHTQSARAYQYWLQLPSQIFPLFCHQFPPVRCWSYDNSSVHTQGARAYQSGTSYSYPLTAFPIILSPSHTNLMLLMFEKTVYNGCQFLLVRYQPLPFPNYCVTNSHWSGAVLVTTYHRTYWY